MGPRWAVGPKHSYLGPFIQEGIPDSQEDVADERVGKDHEEPVESDEREVYTVLPQVRSEPGQLLREEVLEHPLVCLEGRKGPPVLLALSLCCNSVFEVSGLKQSNPIFPDSCLILVTFTEVDSLTPARCPTPE